MCARCARWPAGSPPRARRTKSARRVSSRSCRPAWTAATRPGAAPRGAYPRLQSPHLPACARRCGLQHQRRGARARRALPHAAQSTQNPRPARHGQQEPARAELAPLSAHELEHALGQACRRLLAQGLAAQRRGQLVRLCKSHARRATPHVCHDRLTHIVRNGLVQIISQLCDCLLQLTCIDHNPGPASRRTSLLHKISLQGGAHNQSRAMKSTFTVGTVRPRVSATSSLLRPRRRAAAGPVDISRVAR